MNRAEPTAPRRAVRIAGTVFVLWCVGWTLWSCRGVLSPHQWDEEAFGPLVSHEGFPGDCSLCHVPERWDVLRADFSFDHEKETGHRLEGAHAEAACLRCHNDRGPVHLYLERGCAGCHGDPHEGSLGTDCEACHGQRNWLPIGQLGNHSRTRFPLYGAHLATACDRCHPRARIGVFEGAPVECHLCHQEDLARAQDPDHLALGWTVDCQRCHSPSSFDAAGFAHRTFPLVGAHARADCTQCHPGGSYRGTPRDCYACHSDDYQTARNPDHVAGGFSTDCQNCHNTSGWQPAFFRHTRFPLTGRHASLDCSACHVGGVFEGLPTDCYSCHQSDYQGARDPDHVALGFPTSCEDCHNTSAWTPADFDHERFFPIRSGPHAGLSCSDCHGGGFDTFSCIDCHAHRRDEMDREHDDVGGYEYSSPACYRCHPRGRE